MHIAMIRVVILSIMVLRKFLAAVCSSVKNFSTNAVDLALQYRNRENINSSTAVTPPSGPDEVILQHTTAQNTNQTYQKSASTG